jgi:hypothetical protein
MFIANERRLSRKASRRQRRWDGDYRPPRNWRRALRLTLYTLLGLLGSLALLASVSLMLHHRRPGPAPTPLADATAPTPPAASPAPALAPGPAPGPASGPALAPAPTPALPKSAPTNDGLRALQDQMRDATSVLNDLRRQTDQLRQGIADAARARDAAAKAAEQARQAQEAAARDQAARQAQAEADARWADAERTVRTLPQQRLATPPARPPPPPPVRSPQAAAPSPATPSPPATDTLADATPAPPPGPRPRVSLRYQSGSAAAMQAANDIAQRLLFSDFTYADTRSAPDAPSNPVIRYFHPEDAASARRLADWLAGAGVRFRVQNASARPGRAPPLGTLDVWIGG